MQSQLIKAPFVVSSLGIATLLIWYGLFKFTMAEANGIKPLVANSPILFWMYKLFSVRAASQVIGVIEIITGGLLLVGLFDQKVSLIGGIAASVIFAITSTFLLSTGGEMLEKVDGIWVPSDLGGFLLKDLPALGASLFIVMRAIHKL